MRQIPTVIVKVKVPAGQAITDRRDPSMELNAYDLAEALRLDFQGAVALMALFRGKGEIPSGKVCLYREAKEALGHYIDANDQDLPF